MRNPAGKFHHIKAALHVAFGIGNHLAMFGGEHVRQLIHVGFHKALELEHDARPALGVCARPAGKRRARRGHSGAEFALRRERHLALHLAGVGIENLSKPP